MIKVPPPGRIPIGSAVIAGKRVEVFLTAEWGRYFETLTTQSDGTAAALALAGLQGASGAAGGSLADDSGGESVEFIPCPGPAGPQGNPGPALFLFQEPEETEVFWPVKNT